MVQEFQVLRCYSCQTFQGQQVSKELSFKAPKEQAPAEGPAEGSASPQVFVSQVKKTNRWRCAVCGEKQSVMKVLKVWTEFGRGTGADCRRHVQKLNAQRGEMEQEQVISSLREKDEEVGQSFGGGARNDGGHNVKLKDAGLAEESRWDKYRLNPPLEVQEPEETGFLSGVHLDGKGNARKRKRAVSRADDDEGSLNKEIHHHRRNGRLTPLPIRESCTVQNLHMGTHGFTRGTIDTGNNQLNPGFTRQAMTKDQTTPNFTIANVTTESNQTKSEFIRHVSNSSLHGVPLRNKPCLVGSSAEPPISRWTQFLPVSHPQEEEEEEGEEVSCLVNNMEGKPLDSLGSSATPCSLSHIRELGRQSELPKAVSSQTPPSNNQPCPSLSVNSLFNTGDDFDALDFDDMF